MLTKIQIKKQQLIDDLLTVSERYGHTNIGEPYNIDLKGENSFNSEDFSIKQIKMMIELNSKVKNKSFNDAMSRFEEDKLSSEMDKEHIIEEIMLEIETKNITQIGEGYDIDYTREGFHETYNLKELNEILKLVRVKEHQLLTNEEKKHQIIEEIMSVVEEKYISEISQGFKIDFRIDTKEDLFDNYNLTDLREISSLVNKMDSQVNEMFINVLEIVDRYKDGAIKKEHLSGEKPWWRKKFPKKLIKIHDEDTIYTVFEKTKIARESFRRNSTEFKVLFEFMNELYEEMNYKDEVEVKGSHLSEIDGEAAAFIRATVESIILPHHEAIDTVKNSGGKLILADLWNTNFPEGLKEEVRNRDGNRCIVCNEESHLHVHHKIPRKLGGIHHRNNLVTLCSSCHGVIETGDIEMAFKKCLSNYLKYKIFLQHPVDLKKDIYMLKEEVKNTLETTIFTLDNRNETEMVNELIGVLKKIEYIFTS